MELLISLIAGALGGNIAGAVLRNAGFGFLLTSAIGILGGGLGARVLSALGPGIFSGGTDLGTIIAHLVAGGAGGAALLAALGLIRNALAK